MRPEVEQAAALLRENTPASVSAAMELLQRTVFAFSMKVCGHPEDAEDTMQEVLMRSAPHLVRLTDANALAVWLYTVTRNRCWRMRRRHAGAPDRTLSLDELMPGEGELAEIAARPSPEQAAATGEMTRLVHRAVLAIPPQYRLVLVLHDMEDLDPEQIARVLNLRPGTVRVRLHRARLAVRRAMAQLLSVGEPPSGSAAGSGQAAGQAPGQSAGQAAGQTAGLAATKSAHARSRRRPRAAAADGEATRGPAGDSGQTGQAMKPNRPAACRQLFAQLSEFLDQRLPAPDCHRISRHLEGCPNCIHFLNDLRQAIERCRTLSAAQAATGCDSQVSAALRDLLTREYLRLMSDPAA